MDLTSLASIATILAVPIAVLGWFMSKIVNKKTHVDVNSGNLQNNTTNNSSVRGDGTSISGNIQSGSDSIVFGHNTTLTINSDEQKPFDEELIIKSQSSMYTFHLKAGKYWKYPSTTINPYGKILVELRDVVNKSGIWFADVRINTNGSIITGGRRVEKIETNTFFLPAIDHSLERDELCVFNLYFSIDGRGFDFTVLRVSHIDQHEKVAKFEICRVRNA